MEKLIFIILFSLVMLGAIEALTGALRLHLHIHPPYRHLIKKGILLNDKTCSFFRSWGLQRYLSLILTKEFLILKNSYLTSLANIQNEAIESYSHEKPLFSRKRQNVVLYLRKGSYEKDVLKFCTRNSSEWEKALSSIGIKKKANKE